MSIVKRFLDSEGKISSRKLQTMTPEESQEIMELSSEISSFDPSMKDRIKFILLQPNSLYCSCGVPLKFSNHAHEVFRPTCGDQTHKIIPRESIEKQKISNRERLSRDSILEYSLEEQKKYIHSLVNAGIKPNYFFSKRTDIDCYIIKKAKSTKKKPTQYAYDTLNDIEDLPICSVCNEERLRFISFEKGYTNSCGSANCRNTISGNIRKQNNIKKILDNTSSEFKVLDSPSINSGPWRFRHISCGHEFTKWLKNGRSQDKIYCPRCELTSSSKMEYELIDRIKKVYSGEIVHRHKLDKKEIDIFIPEFSLGIELNGLYWHSNGNELSHKEKYEFFKERGIELVQFTDLDFNYKFEIMFSMILNKIGKNERKFGARETYIDDTISQEEYKYFLEKNHIKGYAPAKIRFGLRHKKTDELLTIFGLSKTRFSKKKKNSYELVRFCSCIGTSIIGALSKGSKFIFDKVGPFESFADLHYGSGSSYEKSGFRFLYKTRPNYWYFDKNTQKLESRMKYQRHKLSGIPDSMTEREYTESIGLSRYYDCGNSKFVYNGTF